MLHKLFSSRNHNVNAPINPNPNFEKEKPLIVKIIHVGGIVERHYMAFPASFIIQKYPDFVLTRPEIFQSPFDSVVGPDEILVPGHKYFVVPVLTVKKLRKRMMKSAAEVSDSKPKSKTASRHVRFKGVEPKTSVEDKTKKSKKKVSNGRNLRKKNVSFSPALTIIDDEP